MGSIEARGPSHCANMLKLVLLNLGLAAAQSPDMMREIMQQINKFNMRQACWGETNTINYAVSIIKAQEKCMQLAPTYDLVSVLTPQSNPFTTLPGQITNPFQRISEIQSLDQLTSLWRTKRQATEGILNPDQDDFLEFIEDFGDFKEDIAEIFLYRSESGSISTESRRTSLISLSSTFFSVEMLIFIICLPAFLVKMLMSRPPLLPM